MDTTEDAAVVAPMDTTEDTNIAVNASTGSQATGPHKKKKLNKNKVTSFHNMSAEDSARNNEQAMPWIEKYRPKTLADMISHDDILHTIDSLMNKNQLPHLCFYGPAGTGKTSTILACARRLFGPKFSSMVLELNASVDNGIKVIREQVKTFASSRQLFGTGLKLIILDECDNMSKEAQFALRRVIEKYTSSTRFCIICNYISKIIPALQSRCMRFRFGPLGHDEIYGRLELVAQLEEVKVTKPGLDAIITLSKGDMRKCMNMIQSCHMSFPIVDDINVYKCSGHPLPSDMKLILTSLLNSDFKAAIGFVKTKQVECGIALGDIISEISSLILRSSMPPQVLGYCLEKLSDIEYRLTYGSLEQLELGALVGSFQVARDMTVKLAPAAAVTAA